MISQNPFPHFADKILFIPVSGRNCRIGPLSSLLIPLQAAQKKTSQLLLRPDGPSLSVSFLRRSEFYPGSLPAYPPELRTRSLASAGRDFFSPPEGTQKPDQEPRLSESAPAPEASGVRPSKTVFIYFLLSLKPQFHLGRMYIDIYFISLYVKMKNCKRKFVLHGKVPVGIFQ